MRDTRSAPGASPTSGSDQALAGHSVYTEAPNCTHMGLGSFGRRCDAWLQTPLSALACWCLRTGAHGACVCVWRGLSQRRCPSLKAQWAWGARGLCTVAPFVQTQGTMQPLLSDCILMLVIMVVTASPCLPEGPCCCWGELGFGV